MSYKKIMSKYLGKEVVLDFIEIKNSDALINNDERISHKSLQKVFDDNRKEKGLVFTAEAVPCLCSIKDKIVVFNCTMSDATGFSISAIGEVSPESLTTDIARMYPALVAKDRGFDILCKRMFQLDTKAYSDREIIPTGSPDVNKSVTESPEKANRDSNVNVELIEELPFEYKNNAVEAGPVPVKEELPTKPTNNTVPPEAQPVQVANDVSLSLEECENFVVDFGTYRGKTLKEIRSINDTWVSYVIGHSLENKSEDTKRHILAYNKYIEAGK